MVDFHELPNISGASYRHNGPKIIMYILWYDITLIELVITCIGIQDNNRSCWSCLRNKKDDVSKVGYHGNSC